MHEPKACFSPWIVTKPFSDSYRDHDRDQDVALETDLELELSLGWLFVSFKVYLILLYVYDCLPVSMCVDCFLMCLVTTEVRRGC